MWFNGALLSRLDDKKTGQIILVMQRLHPNDLSGHLLQGETRSHLSLPAIAAEESKISRPGAARR